MRFLQLSLIAALSVLVLAACSNISSSDDVAACMRAMSGVSCPPGTAPRSISDGLSNFNGGAGLSGLNVVNNQNIQCQYECSSICQCGVGSVGGDGSVVCNPCFGAQAAAATIATATGSQPAAARQPQPVVQQPSAQLNFQASPLYEHHNLTAPFRPDPFAIRARAGGNVNISQTGVVDPTGAPCRGFVTTEQPDITLTYTSRGTPLMMSVDSAADTTLIVNMPDGSWRCNDDANNNTRNPRLFFPEGMSGRYAIWIGTFTHDQTWPMAQFRATASVRAR